MSSREGEMEGRERKDQLISSVEECVIEIEEAFNGKPCIMLLVLHQIELPGVCSR